VSSLEDTPEDTLVGHLGGHLGGHPWRTPLEDTLGGHPPHFIYLSKTLFTHQLARVSKRNRFREEKSMESHIKYSRYKDHKYIGINIS
jgi:hypothetical protein